VRGKKSKKESSISSSFRKNHTSGEKQRPPKMMESGWFAHSQNLGNASEVELNKKQTGGIGKKKKISLKETAFAVFDYSSKRYRCNDKSLGGDEEQEPKRLVKNQAL